MPYFRNTDTGAITPFVTEAGPSFTAYKTVRSPVTSKPQFEQVGEDQAVVLLQAILPAAAAGATSTVAVSVPASIQDMTGITGGTVIEVDYYPLTTINGAATNNRTIAVADTTKTSTIVTESLGAGTNLTGSQMNSLTPITAPAVSGGDTLTVTSTPVGTGIADPGGIVFISILIEPLVEGPLI
jgi:hypothetical protein